MIRPGSSMARAMRAGFGHHGTDCENALRTLWHEHTTVRQTLRLVANRLQWRSRSGVIVAVMGAGWAVVQDDRGGDDQSDGRPATPSHQRHDDGPGGKSSQHGEKQRRAVMIEMVPDFACDG